MKTLVNNLFPNFLVDSSQYELSEQFWMDLWSRVAPFRRERFGWAYPWLGTGASTIKDGNPIFSAHSPALRRGIRVIQEEPTGVDLEIRAWLDTFGGDITDPDCIHELVISCVLSDTSARVSLDLMSPWVCGRSISFGFGGTGLLLPGNSEDSRWGVRTRGYAA